VWARERRDVLEAIKEKKEEKRSGFRKRAMEGAASTLAPGIPPMPLPARAKIFDINSVKPKKVPEATGRERFRPGAEFQPTRRLSMESFLHDAVFSQMRAITVQDPVSQRYYTLYREWHLGPFNVYAEVLELDPIQFARYYHDDLALGSFGQEPEAREEQREQGRRSQSDPAVVRSDSRKRSAPVTGPYQPPKKANPEVERVQAQALSFQALPTRPVADEKRRIEAEKVEKAKAALRQRISETRGERTPFQRNWTLRYEEMDVDPR